MTRHEANRQLETFFRKLGKQASFFEATNFVKAQIGEAFLGFEFVEDTNILSCRALIYRFRLAPHEKVLQAIYAEEDETNNGGGRVVFDTEELTLYLERDFAEITGDERFYNQINRLAAASLKWNGEILQRAAEKVFAA